MLTILLGCSSFLSLFPSVVFWSFVVVVGHLACSAGRGVWSVMRLVVRNWWYRADRVCGDICRELKNVSVCARMLLILIFVSSRVTLSFVRILSR